MMNFFEMNEKIMEPSYTAVVIDEASRAKLLAHFPAPDGWEILAHHCTINMGRAKDFVQDHLGKTVHLIADAFSQNEKVMAVRVKTEVPSENATKHITVAVNRGAGGKPFMSNILTDWEVIFPIELVGVVAEVSNSGKIIPRT